MERYAESDATVVVARSDNEDAVPSRKCTFGFHPLSALSDCREIVWRDAPAGSCRLAVTRLARQLPSAPERWRSVKSTGSPALSVKGESPAPLSQEELGVIRTGVGGGASHDDIAACFCDTHHHVEVLTERR